MLKERPKLDIQKYEDQINSLQSEINSLEQVNDSLMIEEALLNEKITEYDNTIDELNHEMNEIQNETQKKLDSINFYSKLDIQKFFSNRYK